MSTFCFHLNRICKFSLLFKLFSAYKFQPNFFVLADGSLRRPRGTHPQFRVALLFGTRLPSTHIVITNSPVLGTELTTDSHPTQRIQSRAVLVLDLTSHAADTKEAAHLGKSFGELLGACPVTIEHAKKKTWLTSKVTELVVGRLDSSSSRTT